MAGWPTKRYSSGVRTSRISTCSGELRHAAHHRHAAGSHGDSGFHDLRLFAQRDHLAALALERRDADHLAVHGDRAVAHELARLVARGREAHAVDDVVEAALEQLAPADDAATQAGTNCGSCLPELKRRVRSARPAQAAGTPQRAVIPIKSLV